MKLLMVVFALLLFFGHAQAASAPEMSRETKETIEEIYEQLRVPNKTLIKVDRCLSEGHGETPC